MKRFLVRFSVAGLMLASVVLPSAAQQSTEYSIGGGLSVPAGSFPGEYATGFNLLASVNFNELFRPFSVRVDAMANRFAGEPTSSGTSWTDHSIYALTGNLVYTLPREGLRPYVIAGAGYYNQNGGIANQNLGLNGGAGVRFGLGGIGAFAEVRYHNFLALDLSHAPRRPAQLVPISIGITF